MLLSDVSIRRPVFTAMLSLCLVVLGLMGLGRLGTDLYPDVSFPVVVINTVYKGAGPGEIETQVVKPIEDAVAGISGVDKIHSYSRENVGIVVVQFKMTAPLDRAVQDVRDKVAGIVSRLPQDADAPVIGRVDLGATPILTYAVSAELPSQELRRLIDDRVKPALAQLEGAAEVRVTGGDTREVQIDIDLDKARAAGVSPLGIAQRVASENLDLPAGRLQLGASEMTVRSLGQFQNVDEIRDLPVARSATGAQVRLGEIASVTDGVAERRTLARLNGQDAVILEIVKQPGSNTVAVSEAVRQVMAQMGAVVGHGFQATLLINQSDIIQENAHEVWVALIFGGAMAVLIILIFLLDVRGTFISALALPTSVLGTFFVMYVLDYTLNQMTLLGLSLAIGLLIDDAVVVREAITHRLEKGEDPVSAASNGTQDVGLAVLATTLSLVAVFVPVAFMPGIVGQFFRQFGITISVAVLISLFISFTLDPMMSARLAKRRVPGEVRQENAVAAALRRFLDGTERVYESILRWVLGHKWTTMGLTLVLLVVSFGGASRLGMEFMPAEDRSQFFVDLTLPDSASIRETEARTADAEALLRQLPEVTDVYSIVGKDGDVNKSRMRVLTVGKDARTKGIQVLKEDARALLEPGLVGTRVNLSDPPILEGMGDYYPIMVRITGPDLDRVNEEAERVAGILRELPGTADVRVESNPPKPEMQVLIDRARASDVDLHAGALATQLRLAIGGDVVAKLREGITETDIRVRLSEKDRATPERVRQLEVYTPSGLRPLTDVARVEMKNGPSLIEHENRERQIAVYSQLGPGAALGDIARELKARVAAQPLPPGYALIYDGQMKNLDEQNDAFGAAFGLAFVFIYMVLASQFESYKHPLTIMVSLPLALVGALLGLVVTGFHLSMGAMIGIILLMGLVTKNAILLIDGALQNLREGDTVDEALLKAGPRRLRPILMTSAAMAIAMVPTAVGTGTGSEFRAPMAISVIGGVITSTFLTLLVVPVVFAGMERLGFKRRRPRDDAAAPQPHPVEPKPGQAA
ncbi:efflux RND transporter permease subunit [Myxococcus virescens]|uniref:Heavy metal efflux pump, CzcA family/hydrophobe/amphiphile efflux-1 (HAE1) family protein n=1 Tax=Myxococcus virescens TaxID=83456 RepID=A0A511HL26_9BACT|nr:efflux RND transporter permease subunit [Myxococcus virescens]GEL74278.1 nodulation protein NolG [Myxococcus virescens]SDD46047.1 heavy metal efflux pump, CzcA family/hydrophobe/amphiphile efflux-1 (HAE1) family protein [Myxococcus virescens]